jgi:outer membrane lipoprotein carrier protein
MPLNKITLTALALALAGQASYAADAGPDEANGRAARVIAASATIVQAPPAVSPGLAAKMVEDYVNNMGTFKAHFTQKSSDEQYTQEGLFYLDKSKGQPGRFLWDYQSPNRQRLIATGTALYFVDDESGGKVTQLPVKSGLSRLFTGRELRLDKEGLRVTATRATPRRLEVDLVPVKADQSGTGVKTITLFFDRNPVAPGVDGQMQLVKTSALDNTGVTTVISFDDIQTGMPLQARLFKFEPPQAQNR